MARLTTFLFTAFAAFSAASAVKDLTPSNFDEVVLKSGKPALVEFFAPWCGHCKNLAPVYEELAEKFAFADSKVTIAKVDADAEKDLGQRFGIQGFPTLKWFDGKTDKPSDYNSGRDLESLAKFITDKTGIKPRGKATAPSAVEMLSDTTFKSLVGGNKAALVAFTAPWCGHCKSLAPTWEKLAKDFASEPDVLIAKVDCEAENAKATAQEAGVRSYPTINFYAKNNKTAIPYTGGRSENDLVSFINEKVGTHRVAGGGLDTLAGTIPSLDELVSKLKSGGNEAYTELERAAGEAKGAYAQYYAKVAKKAEQNEKYVEKELKRLRGMLAKGGLAPAKVDDLTSRSNILSKFVGEETVKDEL
ncbi:thioredoxin/protein disulfide isomerase [Piedraia hortae CBS 480.64]|uniref:protein disulfide-isomerase n=1 Tax=Piedraia hortae CBS 480.64 TaxID=1314780 RepID=A0A6A7C6Y3_9PEZI|nr:thioredoxin/protein disulfide isomerase [Piedraia hortae CBS 480.64]